MGLAAGLLRVVNAARPQSRLDLMRAAEPPDFFFSLYLIFEVIIIPAASVTLKGLTFGTFGVIGLHCVYDNMLHFRENVFSF